jgi:hypothetical protein
MTLIGLQEWIIKTMTVMKMNTAKLTKMKNGTNPIELWDIIGENLRPRNPMNQQQEIEFNPIVNFEEENYDNDGIIENENYNIENDANVHGIEDINKNVEEMEGNAPMNSS